MRAERHFLRAEDIHARIGAAWPSVLAQLGIPEQHLRFKIVGGRNRGIPGPCAICGGVDRWIFDNRTGKGDWHCRYCGAGSGFDLLMRLHGWDFKQARQHVIEAAGLQDGGGDAHRAAVQQVEQPDHAAAEPTPRVWRLLRESCELADCADAVAYLESRHLWPLPKVALRAHPSAEYFQDGQRVGRFAALVASVRDIDDAVVTAHVTFLHQGRKLTPQEPRKLLSPLTGRTGCAVRLMPLAGDTLGIAEGIETALAAARIHNMPVWSMLCAPVLAKFTPPAAVRHLIAFGDRDAAGFEAVAKLLEHLQGSGVTVQLAFPKPPAKDWADVLSPLETTT